MTTYTIRAKARHLVRKIRIRKNVVEEYKTLVEALDNAEDFIKQGYRVEIFIDEVRLLPSEMGVKAND